MIENPVHDYSGLTRGGQREEGLISNAIRLKGMPSKCYFPPSNRIMQVNYHRHRYRAQVGEQYVELVPQEA